MFFSHLVHETTLPFSIFIQTHSSQEQYSPPEVSCVIEIAWYNYCRLIVDNLSNRTESSRLSERMTCIRWRGIPCRGRAYFLLEDVTEISFNPHLSVHSTVFPIVQGQFNGCKMDEIRLFIALLISKSLFVDRAHTSSLSYSPVSLSQFLCPKTLSLHLFLALRRSLSNLRKQLVRRYYLPYCRRSDV